MVDLVGEAPFPPVVNVPVLGALRLDELEEPVCVILTGGNIAREDFDRLTATDAATG